MEKRGELQQIEKVLMRFKIKGNTYDQHMTEKLSIKRLRKEARIGQKQKRGRPKSLETWF